MFKHESLSSQQKDTKAMKRSPEFATAGYYFLIILLLTITGFLIPFAQTWGDPSIQFPPIVHIHAGLMTSWLLMLIAHADCSAIPDSLEERDPSHLAREGELCPYATGHGQHHLADL